MLQLHATGKGPQKMNKYLSKLNFGTRNNHIPSQIKQKKIGTYALKIRLI